MPTTQHCVITNPNNNYLISDILMLTSNLYKQQNKADVVDINKTNIAGTKGDIITTITIHFLADLAAHVVYNLIKTAVARYKDRADFNESAVIIIDDKEYSLKDFS